VVEAVVKEVLDSAATGKVELVAVDSVVVRDSEAAVEVVVVKDSVAKAEAKEEEVVEAVVV